MSMFIACQTSLICERPIRNKLVEIFRIYIIIKEISSPKNISRV